MKAVVFLIPAVLLSTAMAWGREGREGRESIPTKASYDLHQPAPNRRYDYKQSLKKPFMYNGAIPFWGHHGNSFVATDFIRLNPSVPGLKGSAWRSKPNEYKEWEVEFSFKAFGQSHIGGRGLAFWYTQEHAIEGPVFGSKDQWKGLGVFMDTSDPANQRSNSVIYGIMNDGTKTFPSNPTANTNNFGGCLRDYKNSPSPVVVRVSFIGGTLKVSADTHSKGRKMVNCFEQKNVDLPTGYYFGVSAQGALVGTADDHDLYTFEVYEVNPPPKEKAPMRPHEEEMIKKGRKVKIDEKDKETFEEVQKIVEQQEARLREDSDGANTLTAEQIAQTVGDTQHRIIESLNTIHNKLESLGAPVQPLESTSQSIDEINTKINSLVASLHAMEKVVQGLVEHIKKQDSNKAPDIVRLVKEEIRTLNSKMEDMDSRQASQHRLTQHRLVKSTSWISYVVFLILIQIMAVSVYTWYKKKMSINEKKFM